MGPVKDESGSDQLFTEIRLSTRSLLYINSSNNNFLLTPALSGTDHSTGQLLARVRHMLTAPRKALYYDFISIPGQTLQGANPAPIINIPAGLDDANGPWPDPEAFRLTQVTPDCLEVVWSCTVRVRDCGSPQGGVSAAPYPLSVRWEDSVSFDETWKMTYRRVGTAHVSSLSTFSVDAARRAGSWAPALAPGFHRKQSNYTLSKDGLRCDFVFVDEQLRYAPPFPAVGLDIIQSESFKTVGGHKKGEVTVTTTGAQCAEIGQLTGWAITIMYVRIMAASPFLTSGGAVLGDVVITTQESTTEARAIATCTYMVAPTTPRTKSYPAPTGGWRSHLGGLGVILDIAAPVVSIVSPPPPPPPTPSGADPAKFPPLHWVGEGTSPPRPVFGGWAHYGGYAPWADPSGVIGGPSGGWDFATAISLYAALLRDPCGSAISTASTLPTTSFVGAVGDILGGLTYSLTTGVGSFPGASDAITGAATSIVTAVLSAAASTTPDLITETTADSLYYWDGVNAAYDHWQAYCEYVTLPGTIVLPTCNPSGTNIKVTHSSKMETLRMKWAAKRTGAPPRIPPRQLNDSNWVFVGEVVGEREMELGADGVSPVWEVNGIYEFQALNPALVQKNSLIPPYLSTTGLQSSSVWLTEQVQDSGVPAGSGVNATPGQGVTNGSLLSTGSGGQLGGTTLPVIYPY